MARGKIVTSEEVEKVLNKIDDPMLIIRVGRKLYQDMKKARNQVFNQQPENEETANVGQEEKV